ncbi:DUF6705 family protein [Nonlabens arenilitoris]|nr:DUF6705 family protein [Nonlabens arenilitoris]
MKKIPHILVILFLCSFIVLNNIIDMRSMQRIDAPNDGYQDGDYYKDIHNDLDKFEGVWLYDNGIDKVEVTITKYEYQQFNFARPIYIDKLGIEFKYWENGVLIKETDPSFPSSEQIEIMNVEGVLNLPGAVNVIDNGYSLVSGSYDEPFGTQDCKRPNHTNLKLGYQTSSNNVNGVTTIGKLHWNLIDLYGLNPSGGYNFTCEYNYVLPEVMILIKQP